MNTVLFHADNGEHFDFAGLRFRASEVVRESSLIRNAGGGDRKAVVALKRGFWPFVREFELAIDLQTMPRQPLQRKFGASRVRAIFAGVARAVREMKNEEGSHAAHWREDAVYLGLRNLGDCRVPGVQALIDNAYTKDLPRFFAMLAGTEFVAEELSRFLIESRDFTSLFSRRRWVWGEVHLTSHHEGPSHLEIDLDLARAYSATASATEIEQMVIDTIALFGKAAVDVEQSLQLSA